MGPSEIVDSGRFPGQKSNFAQTCSFLSQYLKEKGSFGDLRLGLTRNFETNGDWMNSTAGLAFTPHVIHVGVGEDIAAKILSFAQQKPRALCILSANGSVSAVTLCQPTTSGGTVTYEGLQQRLNLLPMIEKTDLPIARKASLTRFLEKRKDRITATAPYPVGVGSKPAESKTWMGFSPQFPVQMERHL